MNDTFGDGWNGATLVVTVNGMTVGTYSATGFASSVSIPVCNNETIQLSYTAGAFENENSYTLLNSSGATVFTNGPNPTIGIVYTGNASCSMTTGGTSQTNLSAGVYTLTITDDVGCSIVQSYTITNTNLFSNSGVVTNAGCGTCANGIVNITPTAGAAPYTYLWNNGATTQDLVNVLPGTYNVAITGVGGCVVRDTFVVGSLTSLASYVNSGWELKLFPNPATDEVYLSYNFNQQDDVQLELSNLIGQLLFEQNITNRSGKIKLDTQMLPNGIYFIRLHSGSKGETIKLVISR
jgi:hypothetical protein